MCIPVNPHYVGTPQPGVRIISYSGADVFIHNADIPRVIEALARHLRGIAVTMEEAVREVERDR